MLILTKMKKIKTYQISSKLVNPLPFRIIIDEILSYYLIEYRFTKKSCAKSLYGRFLYDPFRKIFLIWKSIVLKSNEIVSLKHLKFLQQLKYVRLCSRHENAYIPKFKCLINATLFVTTHMPKVHQDFALNIKSLNLMNIQFLDLNEFPNIARLFLSHMGAKNIINLDASKSIIGIHFSYIQDVKYIVPFNHNNSDQKYFRMGPNIKNLGVVKSDIHKIYAIDTLRYIYISKCFKLTKISSMSELEELTIRSCHLIHISNFLNLKKLEICSSCPIITNLNSQILSLIDYSSHIQISGFKCNNMSINIDDISYLNNMDQLSLDKISKLSMFGISSDDIPRHLHCVLNNVKIIVFDHYSNVRPDDLKQNFPNLIFIK